MATFNTKNIHHSSTHKNCKISCEGENSLKLDDELDNEFDGDSSYFDNIEGLINETPIKKSFKHLLYCTFERYYIMPREIIKDIKIIFNTDIKHNVFRYNDEFEKITKNNFINMHCMVKTKKDKKLGIPEKAYFYNLVLKNIHKKIITPRYVSFDFVLYNMNDEPEKSIILKSFIIEHKEIKERITKKEERDIKFYLDELKNTEAIERDPYYTEYITNIFENDKKLNKEIQDYLDNYF